MDLVAYPRLKTLFWDFLQWVDRDRTLEWVSEKPQRRSAEKAGRSPRIMSAWYVLHLSQIALLLKSLNISIRFSLHLFKAKECTAEKTGSRSWRCNGLTVLLFPSTALNQMNLFKQVNFLTEMAGPNSLSSLNRKHNGDLNLLLSMESVTFSASILIGKNEGARERTFPSVHCVEAVIVILVTVREKAPRINRPRAFIAAIMSDFTKQSYTFFH